MAVGCASIAYIMESDTLLDVVSSAPSLLFVNEIGNFMGYHLVKFLNVHMNEVTENDNFLKFEYTHKQALMSLIYQQIFVVGWSINGIFLIPVNKYKCAIFDSWFEHFYTNPRNRY